MDNRKLVRVDELSSTDKIDAGHPVYKYEETNQYVYPLVVRFDSLDEIDRHLINDTRLVYPVELPTDEDIVRYWGGQLVYIVSYDGKRTLDNVFMVKQVDISYDYDYYDLESYTVLITAFTRR